MTKENIKWGNKMIKVSIKFWTNELPKGSNEKTAWASGDIVTVANKHKGLKFDQVFFNSPDELLPKLQTLLNRNGIKLIKPEKFVTVDLTKKGK